MKCNESEALGHQDTPADKFFTEEFRMHIENACGVVVHHFTNHNENELLYNYSKKRLGNLKNQKHRFSVITFQ